MKKDKKIVYIILIIAIIGGGFLIYKVFAKNDSEKEDIKSKSLSEIQFLESRFLELFNAMNNISFEHYKLSVTEEKKQNGGTSSSSQSSNNSQGGSGDSGQSNNSSSSGSSSGNQSSSSAEEKNKNYSLEEKGILTNSSEIDWEKTKNDVENIYTSLYTMTLDLYQTSTNQQEIINFNKEYDNLIKAVKDENKEETLKELSILYDYLPKFVESCTNDEKEKAVTRIKNSIFKAYSLLDTDEWITISENINTATQEFTKMLTDVNNQNNNQYNLNKAYVIINELQNAVVLKDKEIFLIKYKNLLEELQKL